MRGDLAGVFLDALNRLLELRSDHVSPSSVDTAIRPCQTIVRWNCDQTKSVHRPLAMRSDQVSPLSVGTAIRPRQFITVRWNCDQSKSVRGRRSRLESYCTMRASVGRAVAAGQRVAGVRDFGPIRAVRACSKMQRAGLFWESGLNMTACGRLE